MFKLISLFVSISLAFIIASCDSGSTSDQGVKATLKAATYVTMPVNTPIAVTLVDSIDTDIHLAGYQFLASLSRPIIVDGHILFADGAAAKGVLTRVVESGHLKTPAEVIFSLTALQDGNGRWIDVGTYAIQEKKGSHTNREVVMIGGGALVGGIIGKIIDKKGSTEIGAVAGAAAGTGLSAATGKQDIFYGAGSEITFLSSQSIQVELK